MSTPQTNGILLLYHHLLTPNASTIMENVEALGRHSRFPVWALNTELGFPRALEKLHFSIIVLHYSLFGYTPYHLNGQFLRYLEASRGSYKIAFFQDEYRYCRQRFDFINRYHLDCLYTLLEPQFFPEIYGKYTEVKKLVSHLPGYVSQDLLRLGTKLTKPDKDRSRDVGYRARQLDFFMGRGAQEKTEIGREFLRRAQGMNLRLDIAMDEQSRIYGPAWYEFLADCRGVLGVEAGVSIFDVEDKVRLACEEYLQEHPAADFAEVSTRLLGPWEDNIHYRTISPRHFEAAALRVCQILFEGEYSGIMQPMVHYLPLKKDFSNFAEILSMFQDNALRRKITENAYTDLIASGRYSYESFMAGFDQDLSALGFQPTCAPTENERVAQMLHRDLKVRRIAATIRSARYLPFPGRRLIVSTLKSLLRKH